MRTPLKISFVLNVILIGCLFYLLAGHRQVKTPSPSVVSASSPPVQIVSAPSSPEIQPPASTPFRWQQLESATDYRIYIKNLRDIGCPEQTLRDIVAGNVDRAFSAERAQLNLDGSEPGPWSEPAETLFIAELLGDIKDPADPEMLAKGQTADEDAVTFPLVLQKVDLDALGLNDDQKLVIANIRQEFIDKVGGPYQDPRDPAYLTRWKNAQPESDDLLKGLLGVTIFENYQLAAASPPPAKK